MGQTIAEVIDTLAEKVKALEADLALAMKEREALLQLTESLDEHPDDYDGPCWCKTCQSYAEV